MKHYTVYISNRHYCWTIQMLWFYILSNVKTFVNETVTDETVTIVLLLKQMQHDRNAVQTYTIADVKQVSSSSPAFTTDTVYHKCCWYNWW